MIESVVPKAKLALSGNRLSVNINAERYVISGFEYRWFCGAAIPFIQYGNPYCEGAFPLMGYHSFNLAQEHRCTSCFTIVDESESQCDSCKQSDLFRRLRCILDGPGVPFESVCTQENPACQIPAWASSVCYSDWIVYLASVFGIPKVGISRMTKDGCSMGFTKRLISQGAESWIVLGPVKGLESALNYEAKLADEFSYSMSVTTKEKWFQLSSGELNYDIPRKEVRNVSKKYGLRIVLEGDFSEYYSQCEEFTNIEFRENMKELEGHLVSNYGPLIGFENNDSILFYSIEKARGTVFWGGL
ncbi:MAG: DUF2797 domain-containing protein [Candidatus Thorarchaeota archaeon]